MKYSGDLARRMKAIGLRPFNRHSLRRLTVVVLAVSPPFFCALNAEVTGRWDLFERSGSITAAIGLLFASRRYIGHGVLELTMLHVNDPLKSDIAEVQEDILTSKFGLALSAFGTVIWGWGAYLGWWSFGCLAAWALFAIRDTRRDLQSGMTAKADVDEPTFLRSQSRRLRNILWKLSDPEVQRELAAHSRHLAQRADARSRSAEETGIDPMGRQRFVLPSDTGLRPGYAEHIPCASATLRELAAWYRGFAEQAGNPMVWEARLRTAKDLEIEAERMACRNRQVDPGHRTKRDAE